MERFQEGRCVGLIVTEFQKVEGEDLADIVIAASEAGIGDFVFAAEFAQGFDRDLQIFANILISKDVGFLDV